MSEPNADTLDTWGMAWIHQVYRREFGLMPALVRGAAAGDRDRSARVAEHIIDLSMSLKDHHENEDELLWPPLLARVAADSSVIHRMEDEHEQLHKLLLQTLDLAATWRDDPTAENRDLLADVLDRMSATSAEHMGDEEAHLMPLLRRHITLAEWQEFEVRGSASVPPEKALLFIGMGLEDATPYEREKVMGLLPPEVQQMWEESGVHEYQRMRAELLGQS